MWGNSDLIASVETMQNHKTQVRTAFFWVIMQPVVVIPCRGCGTIYHAQNVGKKLPLLPVQ
jgi:ABC-type transport system involved in cytochrome bd biosynthesis fused ATPase/permease subunit